MPLPAHPTNEDEANASTLFGQVLPLTKGMSRYQVRLAFHKLMYDIDHNITESQDTSTFNPILYNEKVKKWFVDELIKNHDKSQIDAFVKFATQYIVPGDNSWTDGATIKLNGVGRKVSNLIEESTIIREEYEKELFKH